MLKQPALIAASAPIERIDIAFIVCLFFIGSGCLSSSAIRSKSQPRPCVLSGKFSANKLIGGKPIVEAGLIGAVLPVAVVAQWRIAAFPAPWTREYKFWPAAARIDNVYGDRNLFCSCLPIEELVSAHLRNFRAVCEVHRTLKRSLRLKHYLKQ